MDAATNPFNPGSGLRPPALVGRDGDLRAADVLITRVAARLPGRGIMLTGLRGVGKTVLLNEIRNRAEAGGWYCVSLEARNDPAGATAVRRALARSITIQARRFAGRRRVSDRIRTALRTVTAFNVSVGASGIDLGVDLVKGRADSGDLEVDLQELVQDLCAALQDDGTAFGVFVDETQDLDPALLSALLSTQHHAGQRELPFYLVGAGLPHLPGLLAESRTYAERLFDYRPVMQLSRVDAAAALVTPTQDRGVRFEPDALDLLLDAAGGYPYFLQQYGSAVWEVAPTPLVTRGDAQAAVTVGQERLDRGFFAARWERATPSEKRLLVAMAEDQDLPSSTSVVAQRMGLKVTSLGPYRAKLINKGLVYAPQHGQLAYTVPGMAAFVHRHREDA